MTQSPFPKEHELLEGLDAYKAHADEVADPFASELDPTERLKGSVEGCEAPFEPLDEWEYSNAVDDERDARE